METPSPTPARFTDIWRRLQMTGAMAKPPPQKSSWGAVGALHQFFPKTFAISFGNEWGAGITFPAAHLFLGISELDKTWTGSAKAACSLLGPGYNSFSRIHSYS